MSEPAFLEHIDKTHPASDFVQFATSVENAEAGEFIEIMSAPPSDELTAEEQAAIDSIGDHSTGDAELSTLQDEQPDGTAVLVYSNWKRQALNDRATELGIEEPAELPNKEAVIAAIEEAEAK